MSTLQNLHDQLHNKLIRQTNAVEITTQQLADIRAAIDAAQVIVASQKK